MSDSFKSPETQFLDAHPRLRAFMSSSEKFAEIKELRKMEIPGDEEHLYVVRGDAVGGEDELFVDSLARGATPQGAGQLYAASRELFEELDESLKALVEQRLGRKRDTP